MTALILSDTETVAARLAQTYERVAVINHHMIGVIGNYTWEEYNEAYGLLINAQNKLSKGTSGYKRLDLALDALESDCQHVHNCKP